MAKCNINILVRRGKSMNYISYRPILIVDNLKKKTVILSTNIHPKCTNMH